MATTYIKAVHRSNSGSISAALKNTINCAENPDKTDGGEWFTVYKCDPLIAAREFAFARSQYAASTERRQGANEVVGYHLRQSFAPGEITPE
jgi:hypothetical protein